MQKLNRRGLLGRLLAGAASLCGITALGAANPTETLSLKQWPKTPSLAERGIWQNAASHYADERGQVLFHMTQQLHYAADTGTYTGGPVYYALTVRSWFGDYLRNAVTGELAGMHHGTLCSEKDYVKFASWCRYYQGCIPMREDARKILADLAEYADKHIKTFFRKVA